MHAEAGESHPLGHIKAFLQFLSFGAPTLSGCRLWSVIVVDGSLHVEHWVARIPCLILALGAAVPISTGQHDIKSVMFQHSTP